jgi:hypothetical protein
MNGLKANQLRTVLFPHFSDSVHELSLVGLWTGGAEVK